MVTTPTFLLKANGKAIDLSLGRDIKSITFRDVVGTNSDKIVITVTNPLYKKPNKDDELVLYFGYDNNNFFKCGVFKVQGSKRINNSTLVIRATGTDFNAGLKEKKSATYKSTTLKDICSLKAKLNNLKVKCDFDVNITHVTQTNQSDLDFLKMLADDYNAIFSVKNETLIFIKKNRKDKINEDLPVFKIDASIPGSITIDETSKKEYKSCECKYHDHKTNSEKKVKVGEGKPILFFTGSFKSESEALAKAEAKLDKENEGQIKGSLSTTGATVYAGANLELTGTVHGEFDGIYSIKSVNHRMTPRGWGVDLEFER